MGTWRREDVGPTPPHCVPYDYGDEKGTAWGRPPLGHQMSPHVPPCVPPQALTLASQRLWETILQTVGTQWGHWGVTSAAPKTPWPEGGSEEEDVGTWGHETVEDGGLGT